MVVLIPVPLFQYIFNWTIVDSSGLINVLNELLEIEDVEIILKFHPRHGRVEYFDRIFDLSKFDVRVEDNFLDILNESDVVVAFESSSVLIDTILSSKPLIYISDYMEQFKDEYVYERLTSNLKCLEMKELADTLKALVINEEDLKDFLPKMNIEDILYSTGDVSGMRLAKEIDRVLKEPGY